MCSSKFWSGRALPGLHAPTPTATALGGRRPRVVVKLRYTWALTHTHSFMYLDTHLCTHTMHSHNLYTHLNTHLHLHTCTHTVDHAHFIWTLRHIHTATNPRYIHLPIPTQPVSIHTHTHTHTHTLPSTAQCAQKGRVHSGVGLLWGAVLQVEKCMYTHTITPTSIPIHP